MMDALRRATAVFVVALGLHTADHLQRGLDTAPILVQVIGNTQLLLAAMTVWFVARRTPSAAMWATALGFGSAVGFSLSHVLPHWGPFSDPFVGDRHGVGVTWYSWVTAVAEIAAGVMLGIAGRREWSSASVARR